MIRQVMMRIVLLLVCSGVISTNAAVRLSVDADIEKDGNKKTTSSQIYELDIQLRNTADKVETAEIEWYFVKRPLNKKGEKLDPVIIYGGAKTMVVPVQKRVVHKVKSKTLVRKVVKKNKKRYITGAVFETYLVIVKQDGKIVQQNAGYSKFLKPEWMGQLQRAKNNS